GSLVQPDAARPASTASIPTPVDKTLMRPPPYRQFAPYAIAAVRLPRPSPAPRAGHARECDGGPEMIYRSSRRANPKRAEDGAGDTHDEPTQAKDPSRPVPGAWAHVPQPGDVASSAHRSRAPLEPARALPAHRAGVRARPLRHALLRRSQLHLRHLPLLAGAVAALRRAGARA